MSQAARTTGPAAADVDLVTDFLAVGGDLAPDDLTAWVQATELVESGVSHVLDVRLEADDAALWAERGEVRYRWDGIDDAGQPVPGAWFDRVAAWALDALATPGARLLTHCHMGVNRGPSAGYAVLLTLGWDPVDALAAIRAARPVAGIAYAEDALEWWLDRTDAGWFARRRHRARVQEWRAEHPLDVERVIRRIRAGAPLALGA
ncbi:hypothetical protein RDV89_18185 [Nocardioides zeae]|uniref:Tyrosine specific protein phosphatases domain-containing protein n=1 Tax=Nocardioides imazamoxiresistens TaxID=3231893 RepID=A0ABU3Q0Y9_9ACTN|nr:hypothetical protein [Nocardioides zeae]MDT9595024.1 hypothetical protein [Nocardioides zeae]